MVATVPDALIERLLLLDVAFATRAAEAELADPDRRADAETIKRALMFLLDSAGLCMPNDSYDEALARALDLTPAALCDYREVRDTGGDAGAALAEAQTSAHAAFAADPARWEPWRQARLEQSQADNQALARGGWYFAEPGTRARLMNLISGDLQSLVAELASRHAA